MTDDPINHPKHYCSHPSGVETIVITRHMQFNLGNVIKYVMRADHKGQGIQDLEKAMWYLKDEIEMRKEKVEREGQAKWANAPFPKGTRVTWGEDGKQVYLQPGDPGYEDTPWILTWRTSSLGDLNEQAPTSGPLDQ